MFCNKDLNKLISEHTNLYSVQKHGNSIATTDNEIKPFIGIQMLMSLVDLPSYMMDCARETWYTVANVMPINRYKKLRWYLHFSNNSKIDDAENKKNCKIQPVIDHVRNNCHTINTCR